MLDKYKIAGYKRHSVFYIVQHKKTIEQNSQLRVELDYSNPSVVSTPQRHVSRKKQYPDEQYKQLSLFTNKNGCTLQAQVEQNV